MSKFRRQLMMASISEPIPPLPYDSEVEWLGYDGLQYIDTGITPNQTIEIEVKMMPTNENVNSYAILGMRNASANTSTKTLFSLAIWSNGTNVALNDYNYDSGWKNVLSYNTECVLSIKLRKLYKNDTLVVSSDKTNSFSFDVTYGLLRNHLKDGNWDDRRGTSGRLYYCKIWKDGEVVRNFITVRVGQVGCLYDKISEQLFYNVGTGNFTLGSDVN